MFVFSLKLNTYFIPEGPLRRNRHLEQRKAEQKYCFIDSHKKC
jgi:hypothetical protein